MNVDAEELHAKTQLRKDVRHDREKEREKVLNKCRHLTIEDDKDPISVDEIAHRLVKEHTLDEDTFSNLKSSFVNDPGSVIEFLKVEGTLHRLVGNILSNDSYIQILAVECCCNLALGDTKTCFKVAKSVSPYFVTILQGLNYNLMNTTLQAAFNLCASDVKTCALLHSHGLIPVIQKTMNTPELRENAAKVLYIFLKTAPHLLSPPELSEMLDTALPYFKSYDSVLWLFYHLSSFPSLLPAFVQYNVANEALNILQYNAHVTPDNIVIVTGLLRLLGNLSAEPSGAVVLAVLQNWSEAFSILKVLVVSRYRHLRPEIYWFLGNIVNHPNESVQSKVSSIEQDIVYLTN